MKIGPTVQKLQHFLQIQDGGRRHLGFYHKFKFDQSVVLCVTESTWCSNLVKIGPTVQKLQHFLSKFKMAAAAILDFVTSANLIKPACSSVTGPIWRLNLVKIGPMVQKLQCFLLNSRWRPPPSWILSQSSIWPNRRVKRYRTYLAFKFGENRSNSSKVTALFTNSRWRPPPSWILAQVQIRSSRRAVRHWTYLAF